jgi:hypothetical protein
MKKKNPILVDKPFTRADFINFCKGLSEAPLRPSITKEEMIKIIKEASK